MNFIGGRGDVWWTLSKQFERALARVSDDLSRKYGRRLSLGSPVLVSQRDGDHVRAPVLLRGGPREFPVAYVDIADVSVNKRRIKAIATRSALLAQAALAASPHEAYLAGSETLLSYP